jgi:DNA-directed RNA polymerase specialized sigma24 family protein
MSAADIGEITGLSARAVAIRVHRTKAILARQFRPGELND